VSYAWVGIYTTLVQGPVEYIVVLVASYFRFLASAPKVRWRARAAAPALEQEPKLLPELAHTTTPGLGGGEEEEEEEEEEARMTVWDVSIVQGPFSVAPCQTLASTVRNFCTAVRLQRRQRSSRGS
jgi:hypothetical protein